MAEWEPTTEDVRTAWFGLTGKTESFDRWLAEVKAQAWEEGHLMGRVDGYAGRFDSPNPYRHDPSKVRYLTVDQIPASNHSDRQGENK